MLEGKKIIDRKGIHANDLLELEFISEIFRHRRRYASFMEDIKNSKDEMEITMFKQAAEEALTKIKDLICLYKFITPC